MKKIETSLKTVVQDLKNFYIPKEWHFMTLNGVALNEEETEVQWIFAKYNTVDEVIVYYTIVKQDDVIPSIIEVVPSAKISEMEIVDMFGIKVEGAEKGLYLDEDSMEKPLSGCEI